MDIHLERGWRKEERGRRIVLLQRRILPVYLWMRVISFLFPPSSFLERDRLNLPLSHLVVKHIIGDSHQPGGETRHAPELRDVHIGLDEGLLSQVVAQLFIAQRLVEKEPTHRRLIFPDKLVKGLLVPEYRHLRHQGYVVELHHSFCLLFTVYSLQLITSESEKGLPAYHL